MTPEDRPFDPMMSLPGAAHGGRPSDPRSRFALDPAVAQEMLKMGVSDARRPIDRLIERLRGADGPAWLLDTLKQPAWGVAGDPEAALAKGGMSLESLDQLKERCKQAAFTDQDGSRRIIATGGYYLAIAAAAVHHSRLITSLPAEELATAMLDLGEALPEPWTSMLGRAALLMGAE